MGSLCKGDNTTTTKMPEWVETGAKENYELAKEIGARPYQTYSGPRIAGLTSDTQNAYGATRNSQGAWSGGVNNALSTLAGISGSSVPLIGGAPQVDAGKMARGGTIGSQFNPRLRQTSGFGQQGLDRLKAQDQGYAAMGADAGGQGDVNAMASMINGGGSVQDFLKMLGPGFQMPPAGGGGPAPRTGGGDPYLPTGGGDPYLPGGDQLPSGYTVPGQPTLGQASANTSLADISTADTATANTSTADTTLIDPAQLERVQAAQFTDAPIDRYMNPYIQSALDPALQEIQRQGSIMLQGNAARATGAGAFGGSRSALLDAETQRNILDQIGRTSAAGYSEGYDKASTLVAADQARKLQADLSNQGATNTQLATNQAAANQGSQFNASALNQGAQFNASALNQGSQFNANAKNQGSQFNANALNQGSQFNAGLQQQSTLANLQALLTQRQQGIDASRAQSDIAKTGQQMNYTDIAALADIGKQQQAQDQANLDLGYGDFLREQNYPQEQLNMLISALNQSPYSRTTYGPQGSPLGQGAGGLMALAGLFGKGGLFG